MVRFVSECNVGPRNFERATGPSQRAGIEDRRDRDSGGYLWECEISYIGIRETHLAQPLVVGSFRLLHPERGEERVSWSHGSEKCLGLTQGDTHAPRRASRLHPTSTNNCTSNEKCELVCGRY